MRFRFFLRRVSEARIPISPFHILSIDFSKQFSSLNRPNFGIAFDIDGVILRGGQPIGRSQQALRKLYDESGSLKIPFLFLTNGGGVSEKKRACDLSKLLGVSISPLQVLQGHSPFKQLVDRFENDLVVAIGKGEPVSVMTGYGYKKVVSMDEYASYFDNIDPLSVYKTWKVNVVSEVDGTYNKFHPRYNVFSERVQAAFVVSDPVDWGRDIQVLCDILRYGGIPGKENGPQPFLYFAADDLEYQASFQCERLGMGAFRIALESIFNRIHDTALEYTSFGKPNPSVFRNAEDVLAKLQMVISHSNRIVNGEDKRFRLKTIYMIGDNPSVDIQGRTSLGFNSNKDRGV